VVVLVGQIIAVEDTTEVLAVLMAAVVVAVPMVKLPHQVLVALVVQAVLEFIHGKKNYEIRNYQRW
jgi:hypothetical protein